MAVHSLQQRGTTLATMVNNEQVGCFAYLCILYTYGELDVCSTLADPTVLNYSGLNIAFLSWEGGRPWMLKLLVMAVYLIACSHVRISSCSASTPLFSYQRVWECIHWRVPRPAAARRDGGEGGAATEDGAEQSARGQQCGERAEDARKTSVRGKTPPLREHFGKRTARNHPPYSGQALHHNLSSCSFPPLAKTASHLSPGLAWHLLFTVRC